MMLLGRVFLVNRLMKNRFNSSIAILTVTGCCFILAWLIGFSQSVVMLETTYYQQLISLAPAFNLALTITPTDFSYALQQLVLLAVFSLIVLHHLFINRTGPSIVFIILVVFCLLMLQIVLAVTQLIWLPMLWSTISFAITSLLLYSWARITLIWPLFSAEKLCQVDVIKHYIQRHEYNKAVVMLKKCTFSDEMFEIAYDLGLKLEQEKNWTLARILYVWLVQFDPGMQDFVERIDSIMNQTLDQDLSLTDITQTRLMFGHYQLLGKKARGATATVYEAHDLNTHQRIALKILNHRMKEDSGEADIMTFLHEAMTVSQLDHPNIVKIHDADIIDDQAYIAMDYIAGYPMSERLRRKKLLSAAESLRIMRCVLDALVKAHHKGIVHGDIKPANIMYDQHRKNYIITDFGAAYSRHRFEDGEKKITGTPAYMSPEQLNGARIDGRSDLFSLAVTIFHLLAGYQPFKGDSLPELRRQVLEKAVELDRLSVPSSIKRVLDKALQKKPYQRFADASQMLQAVRYCEEKLQKK